MKNLIVTLVHKARGPIYRMGFRPKYGSIFFSPSLNVIHSLRAYAPSKAMMKAIQKAKRG